MPKAAAEIRTNRSRRLAYARGRETSPAILVARGLIVLAVSLANPEFGQADAHFSSFSPGPAISTSPIFADRRGNIWANTGMGLARFDGGAWRVFPAPGEFPAPTASALIEDPGGVIWAGFAGGVARYDGARWSEGPSQGLLSFNVRLLALDGQGVPWAATDSTVARLVGGTWHTELILPPQGYDSAVSGLFEDRQGRIWVGGNDGKVRWFDGTDWHLIDLEGFGSGSVKKMIEDRAGRYWFIAYPQDVFRYDPGDSSVMRAGFCPIAYGLHEDHEGRIWVAGECGGAAYFDGTAWHWVPFENNSNDVSYDVVETTWGDIWIGNTDGLTHYDGVRAPTYRVAEGLGARFANALMTDRDGNLWLQSDGKLCRYDPVGSWRTADLNTINDIRQYHVLLADRKQRLWTATDISDLFGLGPGPVFNLNTLTRIDSLGESALAGRDLRNAVEDSSGAIWFATSAGLVSLKGNVWQTTLAASGLIPDDDVRALALSNRGKLWIATSTGIGLFDSTGTRPITSPGDSIWHAGLAHCLYVDRAGRLWCGTDLGSARYTGTGWVTDAIGPVQAIAEDHRGNVWLASAGHGLYAFDGTTMSARLRVGSGLPSYSFRGMAADRAGNLWLATGGDDCGVPGIGVIKFDGQSWVILTTSDGLGSNSVNSVLLDQSGNLVFGLTRCFSPSTHLAFSVGAVTAHFPDLVPTQTVFNPPPPRVYGTRIPILGFTVGFSEGGYVEFRHRLDGGAWSNWSTERAFQSDPLADGLHVIEVSSRDREGNVDPTAAVDTFDVEATPPVPALLSPGFGEPIRGVVTIKGTAEDPRFSFYKVDFRASGASTWTTLDSSSNQVHGGPVATWDTRPPLEDGDFDLRLAVTNTLQLTGQTVIKVVVDNHSPDFAHTSPAAVDPATGGDVFTTSGKIHLYFPPHAFAREDTVRIDTISVSSVTVPGPAPRTLQANSIRWRSAALAPGKTASLAITLGDSMKIVGTPRLYLRSEGDSTWRLLGGTWQSQPRILSAPIAEKGDFAVVDQSAEVQLTGKLGQLSVSPRVFSPAGTFASTAVAIGFSLGRSASVSVKVYSRSGRLVQTIVDNASMSAGANLLHWDGRNRSGTIVPDGLYLVTVEALGERSIGALAVTR